MTSSKEKINGECNCGTIKISIDASSFATRSSLCHCLNCRASSGSLFALNLPTPTTAIQIIGNPRIWSDKGDSGNTSDRYFCGDCGSPIMTIVREHPENTFVKGGLFGKFGVDLPKPMLQLFMRRKEVWEEEMVGVKSFD